MAKKSSKKSSKKSRKLDNSSDSDSDSSEDFYKKAQTYKPTVVPHFIIGGMILEFII
jgi:hypothetical protein